MNFKTPVFAVLALLAMAVLAPPSKAAGEPFWTPPPLSQTKTPTRSAGPSVTGNITGAPAAAEVKFITPAPGTTLRGVVAVKASGIQPNGYVMFRIDGQFVYATSSPYKMTWDTQGAQDGEHIIQAIAFTSDKLISGTAQVSVKIQNRILESFPGGLTLEVHPKRGTTIIRDIQAQSDVVGLTSGSVLPKNLLAVKSRLYARLGQSIVEINTSNGSTTLRTTLRSSTLSTDTLELTVEEKGRYGIATLLPNGLEIPPPADSRRPRIGLGEISLAMPTGPVHEGMTWTSPIDVVADLVQRNAIQVTGSHTLEGLWWMRNRKCARISSTYEIGEIALTAPPAAAPAPPNYTRLPAIASQSSAGTTIARPRMGGGSAQEPGDLRGGGRGGNMIRGQGGPLGGGTARPTVTTPRPQTTTSAATTGATAARLTGLTGTRISWIDIDNGYLVRSEDQIAGTLVLTTGSGDSASVQRLPYSLSLITELVQ